MAHNMTYCEKHRECCYDGDQCRHCVAELRAHYEAVYLAALNGSAAGDTPDRDVRNANAVAMESVRTHAARMAELEKLIADTDDTSSRVQQISLSDAFPSSTTSVTEDEDHEP